MTFSNTTTGDGATGTTSAVTHTHSYTVSLTATVPGGTDMLTRTNYVTVTSVWT